MIILQKLRKHSKKQNNFETEAIKSGLINEKDYGKIVNQKK